jgi:hypothetical protein
MTAEGSTENAPAVQDEDITELLEQVALPLRRELLAAIPSTALQDAS